MKTLNIQLYSIIHGKDALFPSCYDDIFKLHMFDMSDVHDASNCDNINAGLMVAIVYAGDNVSKLLEAYYTRYEIDHKEMFEYTHGMSFPLITSDEFDNTTNSLNAGYWMLEHRVAILNYIISHLSAN